MVPPVPFRRMTGDAEVAELLPACRPHGQNPVMTGIRQHPSGAGRARRRVLCHRRTLTGRFSLKYSRSPLRGSFFERCMMNNFG
jgi:hypothetical protein